MSRVYIEVYKYDELPDEIKLKVNVETPWYAFMEAKYDVNKRYTIKGVEVKYNGER